MKAATLGIALFALAVSAPAQTYKKISLLTLVGAKHDHAYFDAALTPFAENAEGEDEYMFMYMNPDALSLAIGSKVEMLTVYVKRRKTKLTETSPATSLTIGFAKDIKDWKSAFANVGIPAKGMISVAKAPGSVIYRSAADQKAKRKLAAFNPSTHELELMLLP